MSIEKKKCKECGKELTGRQRQFCSHDCGQKSRYKRNRGTILIKQKEKRDSLYRYEITIKYNRKLTDKYIENLKRMIWEYMGDIPMPDIDINVVKNIGKRGIVEE